MRKKNSEENTKKKVKLKRIGNKKSEKAVDTGKKQKKGKKAKRIIWLIIKIIIFTLIAACIIGAGIVLGVLNDIINETETLDTAKLKLLKLTTIVYDKDGNEIDSLSEENRYMISYEEMPKYVADAVISIEDERFETHNGVDIRRTGRAIIEFVINGGNSSFGGSTITQQLVKNITKDESRAWQRKIREWYRAIILEKELEKSDILEAYLNTIYMGEGAYGIEAASHTLFAKSVKDVNIAEAACLAAIIQSPESYNPYNGEENKQYLLERQKTVLAKMLELGKITQEEYDEALKYEVVFKKGEKAASSKATTYFVDAVIEAVIADLMETKNITEGVATKMLYSDGLKIYTTLDPKVQNEIDKAYANNSKWFPTKNGKKMQSAMVVIENSTGYVVGLMGGTDHTTKTGTSTFNRATQMKRQSGSSIKPLTVYGPAFERGVSYPGLGVDDAYINLNGWAPNNFDYIFRGYVSTRYAIAISLNTVAVKTLQRVGLDYSYTFGKNLGLSTLTSADKNYAALALGGFSEGVKVIDMAGAYTTIANGGVYVEPQFYTKVLDSEDNVLLEPDQEYKRVMKATTAYLLIDCMRSVITDSYAANYIGVKSSIKVVGKTGTTDNAIDKWFCGLTPYYTGVVWAGYDDNKASVSNDPQLLIWNAVMKNVHSSLSGKNFTKPNGIVSAEVCTVSGLVATDACRKDTRKVVKTDIFTSGTVPTDTCNIHVTANICSVSGKLETEFCSLYKDIDGAEIQEKSFITRTTMPKKKTSDWALMLTEETEKCDIHTKEPEIIEPEEPENPENPDAPGTGDGTTENPGEGGGTSTPSTNPDPGVYTE